MYYLRKNYYFLYIFIVIQYKNIFLRLLKKLKDNFFLKFKNKIKKTIKNLFIKKSILNNLIKKNNIKIVSFK